MTPEQRFARNVVRDLDGEGPEPPDPDGERRHREREETLARPTREEQALSVAIDKLVRQVQAAGELWGDGARMAFGSSAEFLRQSAAALHKARVDDQRRALVTEEDLTDALAQRAEVDRVLADERRETFDLAMLFAKAILDHPKATWQKETVEAARKFVTEAGPF